LGGVQAGSAAAVEAASMNVNDLLIWLSAKGSGNWGRFRAAVDELQVSDDPNGDDEDFDQEAADSRSLPIHHSLRLSLERLGHAEFFRKEFPDGWRVVPPTLACTSSESEAIGILCGARTDPLMARVENAANGLHLERTEQDECPDRIHVVANDQSHLQQLAHAAGLWFQPDATRMLLAAAPPVDDWQLRKPAELPFGTDWDVARFSTETRGWKAVTADEARKASFGLFRFSMPFQPHYFLQSRGSTYKLPVQVGKYLLLRRERHRVLSYDAASKSLSIPVSYRPWLLVDRALTLCSGLIPAIEAGRLKYQNISKEIALTAAALLRQ
jgi:hypothetical protein